MMNEPIYGCQTCNTTVGRNSCWEHRDKPKVLIADIPKATLEISIRDAKIAELEAALAEEKERWIQEREAWIERQAECVTLREALEEARKDNEELDGTDAAHPAWWRGQDYGADSICRALTKVLDGKEPAGTCGEPYEKLRRRVWEAREDAARYQYIRTEAMIDYCTGSKRHNRISWPTIYAAEPSDGGNYRDRFDAAIDAAREAKP